MYTEEGFNPRIKGNTFPPCTGFMLSCAGTSPEQVHGYLFSSKRLPGLNAISGGHFREKLVCLIADDRINAKTKQLDFVQ